MWVEIPFGIDAGCELDYIKQHLEDLSREQGHPAYLEFARQCGHWTKHRHERDTWCMEVGGCPVYCLEPADVRYAEDEGDSVMVSHWKGNHRPFYIGSQPDGNLGFEGVRRKFAGEIWTRG